MELIFLALVFGLVTLLDKPEEKAPEKPKPSTSGTVTLTIKDGQIDKIELQEKKK